MLPNILLRNLTHLTINIYRTAIKWIAKTNHCLKLKAKTRIFLVWYTGVDAHVEKNTLERQKECGKTLQ